jgi:hypothetical protein
MAPLLPDIDRQAERTSAFKSTWVSVVDVHCGFCAAHFAVRTKSPAIACTANRKHASTGLIFTRNFTRPP